MKHLKIVCIVMMIMSVMIPALAWAEGLGNARLSLMQGDVQIQSDDSPEWFPASVNMPLRDGDRIWVPEGSRAEVQLAGGTQVRLDELSSLDLLNIGRDSSQFYLTEGRVYVHFRTKRGGSLIQIDTPVASLRAYERSSFGMDVFGNGDTVLSVFRGMVHAETRSGRTRVTEGNALEVGDDYAELMPLGRENDWERWNLERDRRFEERRYSTRYLPDELDPYAGDFDDYGRWVSVQDYGSVWIPTVQVSAGWSPYKNGRWSWLANDYVWIGYEPWGWVPYHYGRWDYSASLGWFWIPPVRGDVYWGPGYVGWVRTPTYVAWVPLAPRETYYGYGNYGSHSVNLINVNINTIQMKHKYRHIHVRDAVTTVHHDTFVRGRQVDFKVKENPFLREKIHVGRPDIKPERESRMAVVRDIPKTKEPPRKIREMKVREIRESRPMVKEQDKSVFSHDKPDRPMKLQTLDKPREKRKDRTEERSKEQDKKVRAAERPQVEDKHREALPTEKKQPDEKKDRQQDRQGVTKKEKEGDAADQLKKKKDRMERQDQLPVQKKEEPKPEVQKKKETRLPDEGSPDQQRLKQREGAPAPDRQIQREEGKQKLQDRQPDKQDKPQDKPKEKEKDKSKKGREDKDELKKSGEGGQQPPAR